MFGDGADVPGAEGLAWTSRYIDLFRFDQMTPEYLAINPAGLVPTLVVDGRVVTESSVINESIDLLRFEAILDRMEVILGPHPYLFGGLLLADIAVAPSLFRMSALGRDRFWSATKRPRVAEWYCRIYDLPSFQTAARWPDESGGGYAEVGLKKTAPG